MTARRIQSIVTVAFVALIGLLFFLLPIARHMTPGDEQRHFFVLFGPVSSLYTHASIFGLLIGALPVLGLLLVAGRFNRFRVLNYFLAVVLWFGEGALFSLMI